MACLLVGESNTEDDTTAPEHRAGRAQCDGVIVIVVSGTDRSSRGGGQKIGAAAPRAVGQQTLPSMKTERSRLSRAMSKLQRSHAPLWPKQLQLKSKLSGQVSESIPCRKRTAARAQKWHTRQVSGPPRCYRVLVIGARIAAPRQELGLVLDRPTRRGSHVI